MDGAKPLPFGSVKKAIRSVWILLTEDDRRCDVHLEGSLLAEDDCGCDASLERSFLAKDDVLTIDY